MFYKTIKNLRGKKEMSLTQIKDSEGNILMEEEDIIKRWKEHFEDLLGSRENSDRTKEHDQQLDENKNEGNEEERNKEEYITIEEVKNALRQLKLGKAPGCDEVSPEILKFMSVSAIRELTIIFNKAWNTKKVPEEWSRAVILPIHKKGDPKNCDNYRGISLLCVASKLYESILERRLREVIEPQLKDQQSGFRKDHGVQDHTFTLHQIAEKALMKNKNIYCCFIDIRKAFDTVKRKQIWESLEKKGVDQDLIEAVQSIYQNTTNIVRTKHMSSSTFTTKEGVRQGGVLSPLLFICAIDEIIKESTKQMKKYKVGWYNMKVIEIEMCVFADDLVLVADSKQNLERNIEVWNQEAGKFNLNINTDKTKTMVITNQEELLNIKLQEENIEQVAKYKYLGNIINQEGKNEEELNNRMQTVAKVYYSLSRSFLGHKQISTKTKISVYNAIYVPILTYGCENWVLTKNQQNRLQACEMRYLRRTLGVRRLDKMRNTDIRQELGTAPLQRKIEEQKLRWFGHLCRMNNDRQVKSVWEARTTGKNRRGRPRQTWNQSVLEILNNRHTTWTEAKQLTKNRKEWRKFCKTTKVE